MSTSVEQAREFAGLFSQMADSVDAYRTDHFQQLTVTQRAQLQAQIQQLDDIHDRFTAMAIDAVLQGIRDDLAQITSVTVQARESLEHLERFEEIISVVSAAVQLGSDIVTADYGDIPKAVKDVIQAVSRASDKDSSGTQEPDKQ